MAEKTKPLTPEQRRLIAALLSAKSVAEAARAANVSERSAYRWMDDPAFKVELSAAQAEVMQIATRRLTHGMELACSVLVDTMENGDSPGLKLRAAQVLIAALPALRQMVDTEVRLQALEATALEMTRGGQAR